MRRPEKRRRRCLESFGVAFIDPVNSYALSERALKYGLLFIGLTFVGVALVEVMRRVRVHPLQYLLVGCALVLFFLLLASLGEHLVFDWAYLAAALACSGLLAYNASHILHGARAGLAFGATIAALYAVLYLLLQREQRALLLGSRCCSRCSPRRWSRPGGSTGTPCRAAARRGKGPAGLSRGQRTLPRRNRSTIASRSPRRAAIHPSRRD